LGGRTSGTLNLDDVTIEIEDEGNVMLKENKIYKKLREVDHLLLQKGLRFDKQTSKE